MKKTLLLASCLLAACSALAQGTVNFNTSVTGKVDAPITDVNGTTLLPGDGTFLAQLYYGPAGAVESALTPIGAAISFRSNKPGYLTGGTLALTGITPGAAAVVQVRAWEAAGGSKYEDAAASGKKFGKSELLAVAKTGGDTSGGPPTTPANLVGLKGFALIPEPSTIALGVLGAAALLIRRRK